MSKCPTCGSEEGTAGCTAPWRHPRPAPPPAPALVVVRAADVCSSCAGHMAEIATLRVKVAARAAGNAQDAVTIRALRAEVEAATKRAEEEREEAMRFEEAGMKWLAERDEARASLASAEDSLRGVTLELDRTLAECARVTEERDKARKERDERAWMEDGGTWEDRAAAAEAEVARLRAEAGTAEARGFAAGVEAAAEWHDWQARLWSDPGQEGGADEAAASRHRGSALGIRLLKRPSPAPSPAANVKTDESCTNCGAPRSAHTPNATRGGLDCPPRADGKVPVVVRHRLVGMDNENHCAITAPEIEWRDPRAPIPKEDAE